MRPAGLLALALLATPLALAEAQVTSARRLPARRPVATGPTRSYTAVLPYSIKLVPVVVNAINALTVDLRPRINELGLAIRNQGSRGTCSVHAMTFVLEYQLATRQRGQFRDLSEEFLNIAANMAAGDNGDGGFFSDIDQGYQKYGMTQEALLPYQPFYDPGKTIPADLLQSAAGTPRLTPSWIKQWNPDFGASEQQLERTIATLQGQVPVAVGMFWPAKGYFKTQRVGEVDLIADLGKGPTGLVDGHSVVLVGFRRNSLFPGGGYFVFRNSWGPDDMDHGYGYVSFDYLRKYANDLVTYY